MSEITVSEGAGVWPEPMTITIKRDYLIKHILDNFHGRVIDTDCRNVVTLCELLEKCLVEYCNEIDNTLTPLVALTSKL